MSKRDDDSQTDIEVGMTTAERRRRRRRGGGLRVPSDNVPRRTTPPVVAPVPEDPSLAMSIAYSFTSDASEPVPVEIPDPQYASGPYVEPSDGAPEEALPTVIDSVSGPVELQDFEVKTREMSAVDLEALGLTEPGSTTVSDPGLPGVEVRFKRLERAERSVQESESLGSVITEEQTAISPVPAPGDHPPAGRPPRDRLKTVALSDEDLEEVREAVRSASAPPVMPPPAASTSQPMPVVRPHSPSPPPSFRPHTPTPPPPVGAALAATLHAPAAVPPPTPHAPPAHTPPPPPAVSRSAQSAASELWGDRPQRSTVSGTITIPSTAAKDASQPMAPVAAVIASPPPAPAASQPIPTQPIATVRPDPTSSTQPLDALDVEKVDDALSAPEIDLQDLADRAESSGEFEVEVEEADEIKPAETVAASAVAAQATAAAASTGASGEIKRERAQSVPPPVAPPAASTQPGVAPPPAPAAAQVQVQHPWHKDSKDHKDHKDHKDQHPPPPPPPPAAHHHKPPAPPPAAKAKEPRPTASSKLDASKGSRGKPWFVDLFDEDYLRTLPFLTPQATQAEAEFVANAMGLTPGAQVLDIGCGYGRHAMELAARGFHVVGLDISQPLLARGHEEALRRGLQINFARGDMRELDFEAQFDGAYCLFSTFGYFDDETNKKTVANIARCLKPGGRVLIEILNRDYVIADLPTRVWWEGDGCVVLEEVELNYFSSRIQVNRSVVFDDGRQLEQEISVRAYSLHEVGKLMHAAGFRVLEVSGGYQTRGRFFGNQSRHIIVLAERKDAATA